MRHLNKERGVPLHVLFIGNSATYVHDIPGTLSRLAHQAGYQMTQESIVEGGATLRYHADASGEHGKQVLQQIGQGYDIVFLQDNGNCVSNEEFRRESLEACDILGNAVHASGAKVGIYVRPPYGYEQWEFSPFEQCRQFDEHFGAACRHLSPLNVCVNRAFAFAIRDTAYDVWGPDHAHTSEYGAYLAVCVFFATIFGVSSEVLDANGLAPQDARALQQIADRVALHGESPW